MTSKKKLKKINRKLMAEHLAISGENEALMQENATIIDGWTTYQSTHPDLTGVVTALEKLVDVERERNELLKENEDRRKAFDHLMNQAARELVPEAQEIQREAVERDYPETEAQFEESLARMLHRAEDEGDNHCVIMGSESDGNIKAWIRVMFTGPPENVGDKVTVFNYRGKNYLEYDLWNETKLRDMKMDDVRKSERPECAHAIIYREKNEDKCTDCGAVVWPKPERTFKPPF